LFNNRRIIVLQKQQQIGYQHKQIFCDICAKFSQQSVSKK
jgi:hypothetical protein